MSAIAIEGLGVRRGHRWLCRGLSLRLEAGHLLEIHGANGSGKTTLLRVLAGLTDAGAGSVTWGDTVTLAVGKQAAPVWQSAIAFLGHRPAARLAFSVRENLDDWLRLHGSHTGDRADIAIRHVGLARQSGVPAARLSRGQLQRLALARLLLVPRPIWLLDEPLTALDAGGIELFGALLSQHLQDGGYALAATHRPLAPLLAPLHGARTRTLAMDREDRRA